VQRRPAPRKEPSLRWHNALPFCSLRPPGPPPPPQMSACCRALPAAPAPRCVLTGSCRMCRARRGTPPCRAAGTSQHTCEAQREQSSSAPMRGRGRGGGFPPGRRTGRLRCGRGRRLGGHSRCSREVHGVALAVQVVQRPPACSQQLVAVGSAPPARAAALPAGSAAPSCSEDFGGRETARKPCAQPAAVWRQGTLSQPTATPLTCRHRHSLRCRWRRRTGSCLAPCGVAPPR
jgi:hypothetical protein